MTYEELVVSAVQAAMISLVQEHHHEGITAVDLSRDGGMLKTNGRWSLAVQIKQLEPVRPEAGQEVAE